MKKAILSLLIIGLTSMLFAGTTGKLAGMVKDKTTGEPLAGVNVIIQGTLLGAATDLEGRYFIVNIPAGRYTVEFSMIGYHTETIKNVDISSDLTTKIDFPLTPETIEMAGEIEVTAERPQIQKDLTATMTVIDAKKVTTLPVTSYRDMVGLQTGTVVLPIRIEEAGPYGQFNSTPDDGLHFRGGRTNETAYLFNGMSITDPIWGGFLIEDLPILGLSEMQIYTGTYLAEYGEGMSAVMNMVSEPSATSSHFSYSAYTDNLGSVNIENMRTFNNELSYKGFVPGTGNKVSANVSMRYFTTDGRFFGYIYPEYRDTEGYDKSGTPKKVPMNYNDAISGIASLGWNVTNTTKLILGGIYNDKNTSVYNHFFKYNPYGAPRVKMGYNLGYLQLKQTLATNYFMDISLSRYTRNFKSGIFDDLETGLIEKHIMSPELFSVSGIDYVWFNTKSVSDQAKISFLGQVNSIHQIKMGFDFTRHTLNYERRNPTAQDADTTRLRMKAWEAYTRKPYYMSGYIQDKMEFDKIGMILNIGLRYDRIYPETYYMKDILRPTESEMVKTTYKDYFSPRLGVSYPISDQMAFRFAYGWYYQYPHYYLVNQGINDEESVYPNYSLGEVTQIGDGNINPERTTSYEVGVQVALNKGTSLDITGFYRDMSDLTGLKTIYGPRTYQLFTNDAYGIAKGVEVSLKAIMSKNFSTILNYTYSKVDASKQSTWYVPLFPQNRTFTADWDLPHVFSFSLDYLHSSQTGLSIIGNLSSGYPYSPNALHPNSERGPMQKNVDINLYKKFEFFGVKETLFMHITNIFNQRNVYWVYPDTGKPGVDANDSTTNDYTGDPTAWGPARNIRIGFTIAY